MKTICWIRRDLRLHDHAALSFALTQGETTMAFVFDTHILNKLEDKNDKRVTFIYDSLVEMEKALQKKGSALVILYGKPEEEIPRLAQELKVSSVVCNRDYEPYAKKRDEAVRKKLASLDIGFDLFKDSVFFEKEDIQTTSGGIYKVFGPFKNKWLETFESNARAVPDFTCSLKNLRKFTNPHNILVSDWYKKIGFVESPSLLPGGSNAGFKRLKNFSERIAEYHEARNFPSIPGTSLLSVYLRFGNISVRDMIRTSVSSRSEGAKKWLEEIIWRDFYQMILDANPRIEKEAFKPEYDKIKFLGTAKEFTAWTKGQTGYSLIDAAMRCLNETGMMHNRLRMVVANFLCKTLLIDWRKGEHYFASKLLDYDLASNNGGWQWSSSSGCDAQPYFRIFNPYTQSEKFDSDGVFIRKWCPELKNETKKTIHRPSNADYPAPIVSYELNRMRCLEMYSVVKKA